MNELEKMKAIVDRGTRRGGRLTAAETAEFDWLDQSHEQDLRRRGEPVTIHERIDRMIYQQNQLAGPAAIDRNPIGWETTATHYISGLIPYNTESADLTSPQTFARSSFSESAENDRIPLVVGHDESAVLAVSNPSRHNRQFDLCFKDAHDGLQFGAILNPSPSLAELIEAWEAGRVVGVSPRWDDAEPFSLDGKSTTYYSATLKHVGIIIEPNKPKWPSTKNALTLKRI